MSFDTTMTQKRSGTVLLTNVIVRIDNMSVQEASNLGGAAPYDSHWIYVPSSTLDIQRGDLLQDLQTTDPKTGQLAIYRVFGNPEKFDFDHMELPCEKVVGT